MPSEHNDASLDGTPPGEAGAAFADSQGQRPALARTLTLAQLVVVGIGTIVGAGIYSVIGAVAGMAGRATWASMLLAAAAAGLAALSYAELASARQRAGAEYQFMRAAFPNLPLLAYLVGLFIALNCAASSATGRSPSPAT